MVSSKSKWVQHTDSKGNPYYYNPETGVSAREIPDEKSPSSSTSSKSTKSKESLLKQTKKLSNGEDAKSKHSNSIERKTPDNKSENKEKEKLHSQISNSKPSPADTTPTSKQSNERKAELSVPEKSKVRQFKDLLSEHVFSSETTWERVTESMKSDRRFSLLSTREMKKYFAEFKDKKEQDEKLSKTEYEVKVKKAFEEFLLKDTRMSSILSFSEADELYENEDAWTRVDAATRQKIFEKMKPIIFNKEVKRLKILRDENIKKINSILRKLPSITYQTTWAEAQRYLLDDAEFLSDPELQNMDKEDAFNVFQTRIKELETQHGEEKAFFAKATEIMNAESRMNFQSLLRKLKRDRLLHEDSLWKDIFPYIKDHPSFLGMLGNPGSTPLDIFKIYVHDLKYGYSHDIAVITSLMKNFHYEITLKTSLDSFINMIRSTREGSKVRSSNLHYYYYSVLNRLKTTKKASEPMTPYEKKRVDFKKLLYKLGPDVLTKDCIYANLLTHIMDSMAYKSFTDESEKYKIFKKMKKHFHGDLKQETESQHSNESRSSHASAIEIER